MTRTTFLTALGLAAGIAIPGTVLADDDTNRILRGFLAGPFHGHHWDRDDDDRPWHRGYRISRDDDDRRDRWRDRDDDDDDDRDDDD